MYGHQIYGLDKYGENTKTIIQEQYTSPDLMKYLPSYYFKSYFTKNIQYSISREIGLLNHIKQDIFKQFFITTATWGLKYYEQELDISYNPTLTDNERREVIRAKLRGRGTTTKEMIKSTAASFSGGDVEIIEHNDDYYFTVKFVGVTGVPTNIEGFKNMLESIKPAHLNYELEYKYLKWGDINKYTWGKLKEHTWEEVLESGDLFNKEG